MGYNSDKDTEAAILSTQDLTNMYLAEGEKSAYHNRAWSSLRSRHPSSLRTFLIAAASLICGYLLHTAADNSSYMERTSLAFSSSNATIYSPEITPNTTAYWVPPATALVRPVGMKIIGLVFYGRPMFVNILDCYLQRNLAVNGGYMDEVRFVVNTQHQEDLEWLDNLVARVPEYSRIDIKEDATHGDWTKLWDHAKEIDPDTILVKIDDDIVYIADDAIPRIVHTYLSHPESWAASAQIINTPHSHFWQYHTGALLPYLPDPVPVAPGSKPSWRASALPIHPGTNTPQNPHGVEWNFTAPENLAPQYPKTRWLPLSRTSASLWQTPATGADWPAPKGGATQFKYSEEIHSWAMAAQTHYSFFENLERNDLHLYSGIGVGAQGLWDMQYERYSLNFMCFRAGSIAQYPLWLNDEIAITMAIPKWRMEPFLVDTRALVSHYSFSTQHEQMRTDVLERYHDLANEKVCKPFGGEREVLGGEVAWHPGDEGERWNKVEGA